MISPSHRFIFVHIGRTGGTSLERLAGVGLTRDPRTAPAGNTDFPDKHATFDYYYRTFPEEFSSFFKFTIIRNPYDRLVSAWLWRNSVMKDQRCSLSDFALTRPGGWGYRSRLQLDNMDFGASIKALDYIARYENLEKDMEFICNKINLDFEKFPHTNRTKSGHYRDYYDDHTLELVTGLFRFDIEYFGYRFGE